MCCPSPHHHLLQQNLTYHEQPDPLDDLLTNVQGGLRGGLDFLSIPSGSSDKKKRDVIGDAASKQPLSILFHDIDSIQDTDEKQTHWMTC